jgi:hypothetical protein
MQEEIERLRVDIDKLYGIVGILQNQLTEMQLSDKTTKNRKPSMEQIIAEVKSRHPLLSEDVVLSFSTKFFNHYEECNWKVNRKTINWKLRMTNNWNLDKFVNEYNKQKHNGTEQRIGRISQSALEDFLNKG